MGNLLTNQVVLLGRVGSYKDCKAFENGGMLCTINLGVKNGETWHNFFIDFFNTKKRALAEEVGDGLKEGDRVQIKARLTENKYTPKHLEGKVDEKGNPVTVSQIKIVGFDYTKVTYNEATESWEPV